MNKYPWYCLVQIVLCYCICQYTLIRMHNLDIELGVIFGIYSGLRLSFCVWKHFKMYCPKASKSSSLVGVMIIASCSSSDPVKCVKFISCIRSFLCSLYAVHCPIKWISSSTWPLLQITRGLSCNRVGFGHFGGWGSDDPPPDTPLPPTPWLRACEKCKNMI